MVLNINILKKLQAWTGITFAVFLGVHLLNTWMAIFGAVAYDGFQQIARTFYQFPPLEFLLLGALLVHMIVGVIRIFSEPKRELSPRARWHRYSGFFLMLMIAGHIIAVRGPSWFYDVYPAFVGLSFSMDFAPYYFYPYYFVFGLSGFYHGLNGLTIVLGRIGVHLSLENAVLRKATAVAAALTFAALLGFDGIWTDVGAPDQSEFAELTMRMLREFAP